jgi:hypothetical protein
MIWLLVHTTQAATLGDLSAGDLVISEIHHSPEAVITSRGQWFEVYNASGSTVDLSGLVVSDGGAQSFTVSGSLSLAAGEYALFATRSSPSINGGLPEVDYVYSTTSYSLAKGNEALTISYGGTTFDTVSFSGGSFPDPFGASLTLEPTLLDATSNDTGGNWCPAVSTYGDGDYGTPGAANDDCPVDLSALATGDLVVTEVMHSPASSAYNKGEWFEVYNASGIYVDIVGLTVDSGAGETFTVSGETLLRPGEHALIAARSNSAVNGGLPEVDSRYVYGVELILKTTDTITLSYGLTTFDEVTWNPTDYPGGSGIALQLNADLTSDVDNDDSASWCDATASYGAGDLGSPDADNTDCDLDSDGDGYDESVDCDDEDAAVHPGATEVCDGIDNDCNSLIDDSPSDGTTWYADIDGDYYGDAGNTMDACSRPDGYRTNALDCDDADAAINPAAAETCDGTDDNCSGDESDASDATAWYPDGDGDGYGDESSPVMACGQPTSFIADGSDCDDADPAINPAAAETCDGTDDNCSGDENDASDALTFYADLDYDFYGDAGNTTAACTRPSGYRTNSDDCDDSDNTINPGAEDICNDGIDQDCSGEDYGTCDDNVANLDGQIYGATAGDQIGGGVAAVGDLDGDATGDFAISSADAIYLFDGATSWAGRSTTADASVVLTGGSGGFSGGDIDGDGYDDLLAGAWELDDNGTDAGGGYIIYGPLSGSIDLTSSADATVLGEAAGDMAGTGALVIGDVNDDGYDDMLITAQTNDTNGEDAGVAYLMFGPTTSGDLSVVADAIYTSDSTKDYLGRAAMVVGDVDADGSPDVMINAYREDRTIGETTDLNVGATYLLTDFTTGTQAIATAAAATVYGENALDQTGCVLGAAGDVDGDGYDDVLLTSWYADPSGRTDAGETYLMLGPISGEVSVTDAEARFPGVAAGDASGRSATGLGDINGDSLGDIAIGAKLADEGGVDAGAIYVVLGPLSGTIDLSLSDTILGGETAGDRLGMSATVVPDQDGGGQDDLIVGATMNSSEAASSGAAYLIFTERW